MIANLLTVAVLALAPAAPPEPEEKPKTDPPGVPLEAKLVVKKATYTLDRLGTPADEYRGAAKKMPPVVEVDLVLEVKNTGGQELKIYVADDYRKEERQAGGDYVTLQLDLKGPGAVSALVRQLHTRPKTPPPRTMALAPGKSYVLPITTLNYGTHGVADYEGYRTCWTEPGEYTLTATFKTAVSPKPPGAKDSLFEGGLVTVTTPPVKLKVVEKGKE